MRRTKKFNKNNNENEREGFSASTLYIYDMMMIIKMHKINVQYYKYL